MQTIPTDGQAVNLACEMDATRRVRLPARPWVLRRPGAPDPLAVGCAVVGVDARAVCPVFSSRRAARAFLAAAKLSCRPLPGDAYPERLALAEAVYVYRRALACRIACTVDPGPLPPLTTWN